MALLQAGWIRETEEEAEEAARLAATTPEAEAARVARIEEELEEMRLRDKAERIYESFADKRAKLKASWAR